jgi:hypothetical protein
MTPFALLHTYRQVYGTDASFPAAHSRYDFELGNPLSDEAANLERQQRMRACAEDDLQRWRQCLVNA